jgi:hypothetical protein
MVHTTKGTMRTIGYVLIPFQSGGKSRLVILTKEEWNNSLKRERRFGLREKR